MQWMKHLFFSKKTIEHNTKLLAKAAGEGNVDEVRRLIPLSNPKKHYSGALHCAARNGRIKCVELLIPVSDPKANESQGLQQAAHYGHAPCVELLIPVSNPTAKRNTALVSATMFGHTECVQLLIPVSNPKADGSIALNRAVYHGHASCVELLYPVSDPVAALNRLKDEFPDQPEIWTTLEQMIEAERLNTLLNNEVGEVTDWTHQNKSSAQDVMQSVPFDMSFLCPLKKTPHCLLTPRTTETLTKCGD